MAGDHKDNSDIYPLRDPNSYTETYIAPPENSEIFSLKESIIGVTLSAGVSLCDAFRLDKRLSQNQRGETWRASDLKASRNVDVYLPPLDIRREESKIKTLEHIALHLEALEHPRIVPVLDHYIDPEHGFFIVRKYVNGKALDLYRKEYIQRYKKFTPAKAIKILNDVARALDYAHSADVIHGAICPKNIVIGLDDEVNIANFALLPSETLTPPGEQPYFAPELIEGSAATAASDVFSLAVAAYELLSGRLPFSPETRDDRPIPIPGVPSSVDAVIQKALVKNPLDRFGSCGDFVRALETGFQQSKRIKSVIVTPSSASSSSPFRAQMFFGTAFVFVLCLIGLAIWKMPQEQQNAKHPGVEGAAVEEATPPLPAVLPEQSVPAPIASAETAPADAAAPVTEPPKEETPVPPQVTAIPPEPQDVPEQSPSEPPVPSDPVTETVIDPVTESAADTADSPAEPSDEPQDTPPEDTPVPTINLPETVAAPFNPVGWPSALLNESQAVAEDTPIHEEGRAPSSLAAELLREEGEIIDMQVDGITYRFRWHKGESYLSGKSGFWIQTALVTQAMWKAKMEVEDAREWDVTTDKTPVVKVSWDSCRKFIEKLNDSDVRKVNQLDHYVFALPTVEQWNFSQPEKTAAEEKLLEWCGSEREWYDPDKKYRVVCGSDGGVNGRVPSGSSEVGFRLVIVPQNTQL